MQRRSHRLSTLQDLPHHPASADTTYPCERNSTLTTEQFLTNASGWAISALFKYFPALRTRFDLLNGLGKRLIIIAISLIISLAVFLFQHGGMALCPSLNCLSEDLATFLNIALTVALNSQAAYLLLPAGKQKSHALLETS
jgi:hypothetical protein